MLPVEVAHHDNSQRQVPLAYALRQRLDVAGALLRADGTQDANVPAHVFRQIENVRHVADEGAPASFGPGRSDRHIDAGKILCKGIGGPTRWREDIACAAKKRGGTIAPPDDIDVLPCIEFGKTARA